MTKKEEESFDKIFENFTAQMKAELLELGERFGDIGQKTKKINQEEEKNVGN